VWDGYPPAPKRRLPNPRRDRNQTVPYVPLSHPFVERLIGTIRRECLDCTLFWAAADLDEARRFPARVQRSSSSAETDKPLHERLAVGTASCVSMLDLRPDYLRTTGSSFLRITGASTMWPWRAILGPPVVPSDHTRRTLYRETERALDGRPGRGRLFRAQNRRRPAWIRQSTTTVLNVDRGYCDPEFGQKRPTPIE